MVHFDLPSLRIGLYFALLLFSFILFALSAARLQYTTHLPRGDPLNNGRSFYDPIIAEILVTTLFAMVWSIFMMFTIHKHFEHKYVYRFREELIGLAFLWLMWIVGVGVATNIWGDLSFCQKFEACRLLSALVGFAWLGWIILTAIIVVSVLFSFANKAWMEPMHGRWDPTEVSYRNSRA